MMMMAKTMKKNKKKFNLNLNKQDLKSLKKYISLVSCSQVVHLSKR